MGAMLGRASLLNPKPRLYGLPTARPLCYGLPTAPAPLLSGTSLFASHLLLPGTEPKDHLAKQSRQISKPGGLWEAIPPYPSDFALESVLLRYKG